MNEGGKGDAPRPLSISKEEFDARWDAIFGAAEKKKKQEPIPFMGMVDIEITRDEQSVMVNYEKDF